MENTEKISLGLTICSLCRFGWCYADSIEIAKHFEKHVPPEVLQEVIEKCRHSAEELKSNCLLGKNRHYEECRKIFKTHSIKFFPKDNQ